MTLANPEFLYLISLLPVALALSYYYARKKRNTALSFSNLDEIGDLPTNWRTKYIWTPRFLYLVAAILIIVALSRPQSLNQVIEETTEGIDIVLVLDLSTSMLAEDLRPNRFEAAKKIAADFIDARTNDRIGLVIFRRQSFTIVPPTTDYRLLKDRLMNLDMHITEDGTAIGMGIATAVNRLRHSSADSKVIILLTDGENNAGEIDPVTAADLALAHNIRLYTIGVSTEGTAPYPVDDPVFGRRYHPIKVDIDEPMMIRIAEHTGGKYFRARDTEALARIFNEIDQMETSEIDTVIYLDRVDHYFPFLASGFLLFLISIIGERVVFRSELS